MLRKIYFRADGGSSMGMGHLIRSMALAHMLKDEFECHFFVREPLPLIKDSGYSFLKFHEICGTGGYLSEAQGWSGGLSGEEIVVLDGYQFDTNYQAYIKGKGNPVVCIDDIHSYHFLADIVINHGGAVTENLYSAEPYTQFYLGPQYSLLRHPFLEAAKKGPVSGNAREILICMGGADPLNYTVDILSGLQSDPEQRGCHYHVVSGASYPYKEQLQSLIARYTLPVTVYEGISAYQMKDLMQKCGTAILSASSVTFEYLSVSIGRLWVLKTADNQADFFQYLLNNQLGADFLNRNQNLIGYKQVSGTPYLDGQQDTRLRAIFNSI